MSLLHPRSLLWHGMVLMPLICSPVVWGSYVNKTNPHEYSIDINEHGTNFTEKITFAENNITIIHVPSHNDVDETTYLIDNQDVST